MSWSRIARIAWWVRDFTVPTGTVERLRDLCLRQRLVVGQLEHLAKGWLQGLQGIAHGQTGDELIERVAVGDELAQLLALALGPAPVQVDRGVARDREEVSTDGSTAGSKRPAERHSRTKLSCTSSSASPGSRSSFSA